MRPVRLFCLFLAAFAFVACGQEEEEVKPGEVGRTIAAEVEKQTGMKPSEDTTPCEILDDELLRAHFEIGPGVAITRSPSKYSPHPLCTVSWPKPNAEELERQANEARVDAMQRRLRGEEVQMPSIRSTEEISLSLYRPPFDSSEAARSSFDDSMKRLSEGITASHEDVEVTFQADVIPVEGVGNKAMWAPKMRQLSIVEGNHIFHVIVNTGGELEADLEKAKAIAREVAAEL